MEREASWWSRNWLWAVPTGCVGCLAVIVLLAVGGVAGIAGLFSSAFRTAEPVERSLELARRNPEVLAALGEPIELGWLPQGSMNTTGTTGAADLSLGLSGPSGRGRLFVVATKEAGEWTLERAEVEVRDRPGRIDLLVSADAVQ